MEGNSSDTSGSIQTPQMHRRRNRRRAHRPSSRAEASSAAGYSSNNEEQSEPTQRYNSLTTLVEGLSVNGFGARLDSSPFETRLNSPTPSIYSDTITVPAPARVPTPTRVPSPTWAPPLTRASSPAPALYLYPASDTESAPSLAPYLAPSPTPSLAPSAYSPAGILAPAQSPALSPAAPGPSASPAPANASDVKCPISLRPANYTPRVVNLRRSSVEEYIELKGEEEERQQQQCQQWRQQQWQQVQQEMREDNQQEQQRKEEEEQQQQSSPSAPGSSSSNSAGMRTITASSVSHALPMPTAANVIMTILSPASVVRFQSLPRPATWTQNQVTRLTPQLMRQVIRAAERIHANQIEQQKQQHLRGPQPTWASGWTIVEGVCFPMRTQSCQITMDYLADSLGTTAYNSNSNQAGCQQQGCQLFCRRESSSALWSTRTRIPMPWVKDNSIIIDWTRENTPAHSPHPVSLQQPGQQQQPQQQQQTKNSPVPRAASGTSVFAHAPPSFDAACDYCAFYPRNVHRPKKLCAYHSFYQSTGSILMPEEQKLVTSILQAIIKTGESMEMVVTGVGSQEGQAPKFQCRPIHIVCAVWEIRSRNDLLEQFSDTTLPSESREEANFYKLLYGCIASERAARQSPSQPIWGGMPALRRLPFLQLYIMS